MSETPEFENQVERSRFNCKKKIESLAQKDTVAILYCVIADEQMYCDWEGVSLEQIIFMSNQIRRTLDFKLSEYERSQAEAVAKKKPNLFIPKL